MTLVALILLGWVVVPGAVATAVGYTIAWVRGEQPCRCCHIPVDMPAPSDEAGERFMPGPWLSPATTFPGGARLPSRRDLDTYELDLRRQRSTRPPFVYPDPDMYETEMRHRREEQERPAYLTPIPVDPDQTTVNIPMMPRAGRHQGRP